MSWLDIIGAFVCGATVIQTIRLSLRGPYELPNRPEARGFVARHGNDCAAVTTHVRKGAMLRLSSGRTMDNDFELFISDDGPCIIIRRDGETRTILLDNLVTFDDLDT